MDGDATIPRRRRRRAGPGGARYRAGRDQPHQRHGQPDRAGARPAAASRTPTRAAINIEETDGRGATTPVLAGRHDHRRSGQHDVGDQRPAPWIWTWTRWRRLRRRASICGKLAAGRRDRGEHGGRGDRRHRRAWCGATSIPAPRTCPKAARWDALEDLTTTSDGPIKLVAEAGTHHDQRRRGRRRRRVGPRHGRRAVGSPAAPISDVIVNATVTSGSGHITLDAGQHVDVNAAVTVSGGGGTVYAAVGRGHGHRRGGDHGRRRHADRSGHDISPDGSDQQHGGRHRSDRRSERGSVGHGRRDHHHGRRAGAGHGGSWTMDGDATITAAAGGQRRAGPGGRRTSRWA